MHAATLVTLKRDVSGITVPDGDELTLPEGQTVRILQELGGAFTVMAPTGARFRIEGKDADALGKEVPQEASGPVLTDTSKEAVEKACWDQMRKVYDPEIPFNIVDVGLIYECKLEELPSGRYEVKVLMTLTAPGCGIGDILVDDVRRKVSEVPGVKKVDVTLTFDPPWDFSRLSEDARLALNL